MAITEQEQAKLEALVDRVGLSAVIDALSDVAMDKCNHISTNWQDVPLSKKWKSAGGMIYALSQRKTIRELSTVQPRSEPVECNHEFVNTARGSICIWCREEDEYNHA